VNFRKGKVSKAATLVSLAAGLLVVAPSPPPLLQQPSLVLPAALARAVPPPLAMGLAASPSAGRVHATSTCTNVRRELRFEMITADSEPYPPTWRNPAVCLAVYISSE
jgi:hypothetical protein